MYIGEFDERVALEGAKQVLLDVLYVRMFMKHGKIKPSQQKMHLPFLEMLASLLHPLINQEYFRTILFIKEFHHYIVKHHC